VAPAVNGRIAGRPLAEIVPLLMSGQTVTHRSLRVLLTNHYLGEPGGTEVAVRDLALGLLRRGHRPVVYAPVLGRTARTLREATIPVVDDPSRIAEAPDIIHGSHTPTIIESLVRFPRTPAIQVFHSPGYPDVGYPMSEPLAVRQVRRFVAVDENTREYLVGAAGIAPQNVRVVLNAVDLRRIPERTQPLPARPQKALIFTKTESQVPIVTEACRRAGIEVALLGRGVGRVVTDPERELVACDLVFATARGALEAIAAGAATIVMDGRGLAGMATRANLGFLRRHNFGARALRDAVTTEAVEAEIARYDAGEAAALSADLRALVDIEPQLDAFENLYAEVIAEASSEAIDEAGLLTELGPFLHRWLPRHPGTEWPWQRERAGLIEQVAQRDAMLARERSERIRFERRAKGPAGHRPLQGPFGREQNAAWHYGLSADPLLAPLEGLSDDSAHEQRSTLTLFEDGVALGPAHSPHFDIRRHGGGRYSHWEGNWLLFSTSDNTDPNKNGREYSVAWTIED